MFEFAASEFDSIMISKTAFRRVGLEPLVSGGSLAIGVDELQYTDGKMTVTFTGSNSGMHLKIECLDASLKQEIVVNESFTDFGAIRETIQERIR